MIRLAAAVLALTVAAFALIGVLHTLRGTAVRRVLGVGADGPPVAVTEPAFAHSVALLNGTSLSEGNQVSLALDGDGTYERVWTDLRSATRSITLQIYYGAPGVMADTLRQILLERAAAGVQIFLLYDAFGSQGLPGDRLAELRRAGILVSEFRPLRLSALHLAQNRSHVRGIVIDGRVGWSGGFGIDDKWLGDGRRPGSWRETNVRFEGPAVHQLEAAFAAAWAEATGVLVTGRVDDRRSARGRPRRTALCHPGPGQHAG